jgi:hypothetical protein
MLCGNAPKYPVYAEACWKISLEVVVEFLEASFN